MNRFLAFVLVLSSQTSLAAEFGGYVTIASDYVKRGVTQSDGNPAFQIGAEVAFGSGLFLGVWSSTVDIANGPSSQRDLQVNYYAGYAFDASNSWQFSIGAVAYEYPVQTGSFDYSYEELMLGANFNDRVWLEFAYSPDLYGSGRSFTNVDLFAEWPINSIWAIGAGAGYNDTSNLTGRAYQYWQLGVTASLDWAYIDLRVHDTARYVRISSNPGRANSRLVLSIKIPF